MLTGNTGRMTDVELFNKMFGPCGGYTVLGYPAGEKDAALTMSFFDPAMVITEQCSDKKGAWEFLRGFFLYDYQMTSNAGGGIPSRKDAFAKKLEYASATEKYTDEDGTEVVPVETEGFFAGDKTAEETADIVQSRVEIYVGENS